MNKVVIFDLDGVVINSSEVQKQALFESYRIIVGDDSKPSFEEFLSHSGNSISNIFQKMSLPLDMIEPYRKISRKNIELIKVYKGIKELIVKLKRQGFNLAICTGKERDRTVEILDKLDLLKLFDVIVCSDDVINPKPYPDSLLLALSNIEAIPENAVMIGDAKNDILSAKRAEVKSIAVTWGEGNKDILEIECPDYLVNTMSELDDAIINSFEDDRPTPKYLVNDFVIAEENCNMNCAYCLTGTSQLKEKHKSETSNSNKAMNYLKDIQLKENIDGVSNMITDNFDVAILKVSGGELFMINEITEYIRCQANKYKAVQILTNGLLLSDKILRELKNIGNVCIQLSIDHHTLEGNVYRTGKVSALEKILHSIDNIADHGIPLEINCVLTDKNTSRIHEFADYLLKYDHSHVMLFPFPVRGANRDLFYPIPEQLSGIEELIDNYDHYEKIMAPKVYLDYLLRFLRNGHRDLPCFIPGMTIGTFDDGTVTPCPNYWFTSLGSLLSEDKLLTVKKIGNDKIYRVLLNSGNKIRECRKCYTPWDTLNLYLAGVLSLDELCVSPLYSFPGIREHIINLKKIMIN
ncbi:MAG: hypothetical protein RHS_1225 [Robinsoniella sp. RHS]|uniref:HAD-IA family hydrolase n=1 Tax=Robinsoniella sp. RHS TaxID=1504536 RepID=UPI000658BE90|nr:MAG: hypothetical protein RHS_1225 [Robinsoniella sp. RHS]